MRFELFLAARYLRSKRRQAVIGVVTLISVIGVAAGVASLIIALAITNGMRRDLEARLVGSTAHVDLMRVAADGMKDWRPLVERLRKLPHVKAAAPGLYGQVLISRGARSGGGLIKGILPAEEKTVTDLLQAVREGSAGSLAPRVNFCTCPFPAMIGGVIGTPGSPLPNGMHWPMPDEVCHPYVCSEEDFKRPGSHRASDPEATPPIVIGKDLAETLGAQVGDTVLVTSPQGGLSPLGMVPRFQQFQVVGIFNSGFYQYDSSYALMRLEDAQRLFSEPDVISIISFKVDDMYKADAIGREIEAAAGPGFQATNWMEQNHELFRALKLEQVVTFIVLALIVCVAALNILIALTMMVMEKTRDIAVMMGFGVTAGQIRRVFLLQGLMISGVGTVVGMVVGFVVSWAGGHYHFIPLDATVYSLDSLPFAPRWTDAVLVGAVSLGVSALATLYPSRSAAKVLPAESLRYQ